MGPVAQTDRHDGPGLVDEFVPGEAAVVEDIVVGSEDAVGEPVAADELPDVLDRVKFGRFWRQRHQGDVVGDGELVGEVPAGLVEQQHGVGVRRHHLGDFGQVQRHRGGVAAWQDKAGGAPPGRADRAEDIGRAGALVVRRGGPRAAPRPEPGDLVLLADPGFILEPDLYRLARRVALGDLVEAGGEVFLNASRASVSWAWCRGRADKRRKPMPRNSRLSVCLLIEMRNSSNTHCARSINRQRTTPWIAGIGPLSTIRNRAWRCSLFNSGGLPGALPSTRPDGPRRLKASTQSRTVCSPTPPILAASVRDPPS